MLRTTTHQTIHKTLSIIILIALIAQYTAPFVQAASYASTADRGEIDLPVVEVIEPSAEFQIR